ncbi:hypothetical protein LOD99_5141 [Oopsacas minuta]|uniref:RING-CH-type domain-containing protein n=1 Tax=Oopsacas minuta TaxID=111878 RepID=A0AAV7JS22_9METZ|nr:hypothetical protein LOD99_5141 [Oopsacas minuta]
MPTGCCGCYKVRGGNYSTLEEDVNQGDICRICFDGGAGLIAPCLCTGSSKWVHRKCLDNWRATNYNLTCFTHCNTCTYEYRLCMKEPRVSKRVKLCMLLTRDILTLLIIVELLIVAMSAISYGLDIAAGRNIWHLFPYESWPVATQVGVYYLAGIVFFFASLGIIGIIVGSFCLCCQAPSCCRDPNVPFLGLYCCWFGYPCHMGYYYPVAPLYGGGCGGCTGCTGCTGTGTSCNMGGNSHVLVIMLLVILVILVIIGIIFATIILVLFIFIVGRRHFNILYKRERAKEEVVCDLSMYDVNNLNKLPKILEYEGAPQEV